MHGLKMKILTKLKKHNLSSVPHSKVSINSMFHSKVGSIEVICMLTLPLLTEARLVFAKIPM